MTSQKTPSEELDKILDGNNDGVFGFNIEYKSTIDIDDNGKMIPAKVALKAKIIKLIVDELETVYENIDTGNVYLALGKVKDRINRLQKGNKE